jgi:hypothetical protein
MSSKKVGRSGSTETYGVVQIQEEIYYLPRKVEEVIPVEVGIESKVKHCDCEQSRGRPSEHIFDDFD